MRDISKFTIVKNADMKSYTITTMCEYCNEVQTFNVRAQSWFDYWYKGVGMNCEKAFPELDKAILELFISGMCGNCWNRLIANVGEDDEDTSSGCCGCTEHLHEVNCKETYPIREELFIPLPASDAPDRYYKFRKLTQNMSQAGNGQGKTALMGLALEKYSIFTKQEIEEFSQRYSDEIATGKTAYLANNGKDKIPKIEIDPSQITDLAMKIGFIGHGVNKESLRPISPEEWALLSEAEKTILSGLYSQEIRKGVDYSKLEELALINVGEPCIENSEKEPYRAYRDMVDDLEQAAFVNDWDMVNSLRRKIDLTFASEDKKTFSLRHDHEVAQQKAKEAEQEYEDLDEEERAGDEDEDDDPLGCSSCSGDITCPAFCNDCIE